MDSIEVYLATVALNSLWQVTLVAAAGWLANWLVRRGPGEWQHWLWTAAAAACALAPWISAPWPGSARTGASAVGVPLELRAASALSWLLAAACAVRVLRIVRAYGAARRLRRQACFVADARVVALARRHEARLGLNHVDLLASNDMAGPVTVGILHPAVLLPRTMVDRGDEEVLEAALAHELAHVRRRDSGRKLAEELLLALVSWHPAAWWVRRRLDHSRELACDELAADALGGNRRYSKSLVAIAVEVAGRHRTAAGLCSMGEGSLQQRVERLLSGRRERSKWRAAAGSVALAGLAVLAGSAVVVPTLKSGRELTVLSSKPTLQVGELGDVPLRITTPPPPPPPPPPPAAGKPKK